MISLTRNDYEPDLVFFSKEKANKFTEEQIIFPTPDFVVEILSKSTAKIDKTVKKEDYGLHGIQEYWIVDWRLYNVVVYRRQKAQLTLTETLLIQDMLTSPLLPGFECALTVVFEQ